jgi:CRP/FNR family cyclic AMP-dependent transcriptional regulator
MVKLYNKITRLIVKLHISLEDIVDNFKEFLARSELFKDIAEQDQKELLQSLQMLTIPEEEHIFEEDDLGDNLYLLLAGTVKISVRSTAFQSGQDLIRTLHPGDIFGEFSFIDGRRRSASAIALKNCRVAILTRSKFDEFIRKKPQSGLLILQNIVKVITDRARNTASLWRSSQ